ncbi:glycosyltransferase family 1 protein [Corallococcus sp. CA053C]|uniref:glycosyltransferase family 4 protein n=1 Tax=Corallococcus sp. CA053C TaxID=2316732 RepID=UPI000EA3DEF6|nr:glycosyltransferase family 4 protein [Corallococcus sp. CA053C]RKH12129.1 glycosyltransferase family 1 protein [Corallococcus sp. CA053C]
MRVLHVSSGNLYGGIETFLRTLALARAQRGEGPEHAFALCFEGRIADELRAAGAPLHLLGPAKVSRPWRVWEARRALMALLEREAFSAVVCHAAWPQALFGPVVRTAGVPLVFFQHDALTGAHWVERWARVTVPELALCNSRYTAGTLARVYPRTPWRVLHPPVPEGGAALTASERASLRGELGASAEDVVIVHASRMQEWKGQRLLLEALGRLRQVPRWKAWLVGGAQRPEEVAYEDSLKAQVAGLGLSDRVRFLGQRSDVPRLLRAAEVHCQPNTGPEPFGLAFVEALYAGLPVVTTALGGPLEIVDASCGVLVPPKPEMLASALRGLIEDEAARRTLGRGGPARAKALSAPSVFLRALEDAVRSVVREPLS